MGVFLLESWCHNCFAPLPMDASLSRGRSFTSDTTGRPATYRRGMSLRTEKAHYLFIASLRHPALYDDLLQRFSDDPNVQVVLDSRRVERRQAEFPVALDRRHADRRQRLDVDEELRSRSVAVVTLP
jgi:hypothetical protein